MATLNEDYVSKETAKLMKDKRFDGECRAYYKPSDNDLHIAPTPLKYKILLDETLVLAPTLQMAMKWLREVYDLIIYVKLINDGDIYHDAWGFIIYNKFTNKYVKSDKLCFKYEQACETAIKYCLELI